ncbi:hypothetical protein PsAD2_01524 [Pseudovibrio axinellae]|uniref:Uncharacterized protein n=1 Tax=Pseudovibrio axinellae TaxID=989403 RepID=A0A165ZSG7_9HYPH|nr:hypothetical protein [Pseudovibrio axinellae]KZL20228.1 hypothetical protein PsAD2_01524 [Pseudovibrio axinellae]SEQ61830.1 hypothetical protein SAMN05421798_103245 [Pseudovibrio axinellae]
MKSIFLSTCILVGALSTEASASNGDPSWWVPPGESDSYSLVGLAVFFLAFLLIVHLYSRFDRYAEHKAKSTPLRTTIPVMLTVALAYEIMPALDHFSILLPTALILTAIARDFMLWWTPRMQEAAK